MIRSIELINWKTHRHTKLEFKSGVNVLIGIMGAGKSSVLDAISFALFGTFPALKSRRVASSDLITNRPEEEQEATVKLDFDANGSVYSVSRTISLRGSSTAKLEKDGSYVQAQAERVNEEIGQVLKIDYDTFSRAIYAEQNNLDYFLELTKSDRKKQIDGMLGLDQFAAAEDNATSLINSIKAMISDEEGTLAQIDIKSYRAQLEKLAGERKAMEGEMGSLRTAAKAAETEAEALRKELAEAKALQSRKNALAKEIASMGGKIAAMEGELAAIEKLRIDGEAIQAALRARKAERGAIDRELERLKSDFKDATARSASLSAVIRANELKLKERDRISGEIGGRSLESSKNAVRGAEKSLKELNDAIARHRALEREIGSWLEELRKHIGKCPLCERELDSGLKEKLLKDKTALLESTAKESEKLARQAADCETALNKAKEESTKLAVYTSKLRDYEGLDGAISKDRNELSAIKPRAAELEKGLESKEKERDSMNEAINKLNADMETARRKEAYSNDVKKGRAALEQKAGEMDAIKVDDKTVDLLQEKLGRKDVELGEAKAKLGEVTRHIATLQSQIEDRARQIGEFDAIEARIERRRAYISNLNKFKTALMDTEALLRNRLVSSINGLMDGLWPELYPYGDYRSIRLTSKKDDYLLEADLGGGDSGLWEPVDSVASGGERTVACLVMRVAMSMVIVPNLKWIILDEPTHNLDSNGIAKLISVLGESLPKVVEQIFVITHEDDMKQIGSAVVYTLDRDKSADGPTTVSEL